MQSSTIKLCVGTLSLLAGGLALSTPLAAADKQCTDWAVKHNLGSNACETLAGFAKVKQAVPDSPAFAILGLQPQNIVRPRRPDDFATSLLNGVDPNGNFQQGIAIDTAPYMLMYGDELTLYDYQTNDTKKFLSNMQLSIATAKGTDDDDKAQRLAVGLHFTPYIANDPLTNGAHIKCLQNAISAAFGSLGAQNPPLMSVSGKTETEKEKAERLAYEEKKLKAVKEKKASENNCADRQPDSFWNQTALTLGITPAWTSKSGDLDDLDSAGVAIWASYSYDLKTSTLFTGLTGSAIVHAKYRTDETIAVSGGSGQYYDRDTLIISGGYRFGKPDLNFTGEVSYIDADNSGRADDSYLYYSANVEYKVPRSDFWLNLSAGSSSGKDDDAGTSAKVSLKWAFNDPTAKKAKPEK